MPPSASASPSPPSDGFPYQGPRQLFIGNEFVWAASGKTFPTVRPSTGEVLCHVAEGDAADIARAVEAASAAFERWRKVSGDKRGQLLLRLAALVEQNVERLAETDAMDNGMTITLARIVVGGLPSWLRHFAGYADKLRGSTIKLPSSSQFSYTLLEPVGVVGAIVPWNFPLSLAVWKLAPAIAAGNTLVIKPSEKTPLSILRLAELVREAGFPPGVVNVVPGFGPTAGEALARDMRVRKITFTGSVTAGRAVLKASAESNLKRVTLELGGKSPIIVCEDCDVDEAALFAYNGIFIHQGQFCAAGSRVYVHEAVYDRFVERTVELASARLEAAGEPLDEGTMLGPVVDDLQFKRVSSYIAKGREEGATVAFGGQALDRPGFYLQPTVFSNVTDSMTIAREEIFGPVQCIIKFSDLKDAIRRANNTEFGLASGVFTKDVGKAHAIARELEAGTVWINTYGSLYPNTPFGGYKQSGIGRENGEEVLKEYLNTKAVTVQLSSL